ncbi:MAG: kelch repeat-containing protein, partial [Myxococcota bacterium]
MPKENGILLFGGQDSPTNRLGDTWLWQNGAWSSPSTAINPSPRSKGALIYEASTERTILTGGRVNADQDFLWGGAGWEVLNLNSDAEFFESPFVGHHAGRGVTLYYSGADIFDFVDGLQDSQLRLEDDRWVADTSALPPKNRGHMFAYHDAAGTSVFYGGYVQDFGIVNELNDLWTWDGTVWRNIASAAPPPGGRHSAVFYYEPSRNALTLYDGASDEPVATHSLSFSTNTYAWSTSGNTGTVPGEQERYAGAYDAGRDRFYLFSDTLRVRSGGAFWSIAPVGRSTPSARSAAAMVYDELHDRLVMFGGEVGGNASDETWLYDAAEEEWTLISSPGGDWPAPRLEHRMVYVPESGLTYMFGGERNSATSLGDLWAWDGATWNEVVIDGARPSARQDFGLS